MPQLLKPVRPVFCNRRSHHNEVCTPTEGSPCSPRLESLHSNNPVQLKRVTIILPSLSFLGLFVMIFFLLLMTHIFPLFAYLVTVDQMLTFTLLIGKFYFVFLARLCSGIAVLKHLFKLCLDGLSFILSGYLALY